MFAGDENEFQYRNQQDTSRPRASSFASLFTVDARLPVPACVQGMRHARPLRMQMLTQSNRSPHSWKSHSWKWPHGDEKICCPPAQGRSSRARSGPDSVTIG